MDDLLHTGKQETPEELYAKLEKAIKDPNKLFGGRRLTYQEAYEAAALEYLKEKKRRQELEGAVRAVKDIVLTLTLRQNPETKKIERMPDTLFIKLVTDALEFVKKHGKVLK